MATKKIKRPKPSGARTAGERPTEDAPLRVVEEVRADLGEASAIVPLGGRAFLVADDEGGVRLLTAATTAGRGKATSTVLFAAGDDARVAGLEGMCRAGDRILAVRERDGHVVSFAARGLAKPGGAARTALEDAGVLERPPSSPGKKNKGWEGLAFLPASLAFDDRGHVVAVHEGKPRAVGLFAWPSLKPEAMYAIEGPLAELLPDLSDVAVHPKTGELWIASDEGERVVRVGLRASGLQLMATHALPVEDGEKPEGLAFDEDGALWLVTDDSSRLLRLG